MTHQMAHEARSFDHDLSRRVRGEYLEMPGLRLTLPQACRLWNVNRATGQRLLDALVLASFLRQRGEHYVRADTDRPCPSPSGGAREGIPKGADGRSFP